MLTVSNFSWPYKTLNTCACAFFQLLSSNKFLKVRMMGKMAFHFKTFINLLNGPPESHAILDFHQKSKLSLIISDRSWQSSAGLSMATSLSLLALAPLGLEVSKLSSLFLTATSHSSSSFLLKYWILRHWIALLIILHCCQHILKDWEWLLSHTLTSTRYVIPFHLHQSYMWENISILFYCASIRILYDSDSGMERFLEDRERNVCSFFFFF